MWKIVEHPSKSYAKSLQNQPKINPKSIKIRPWSVFGAKSRPGRQQDAQGSLVQSPPGAFLAENVAPRLDFWTPEKSKIAPKTHF